MASILKKGIYGYEPLENFNHLITKASALGLILSLAVSLTAQAKVAVLDRVVAVVNDDIVLRSELNQRTTSIYAVFSNLEPTPL